MRKFKTLCMGLVVAMVLSVACVGVSAATPPAKTSPANKTVSTSENVALTASDKAAFAQELSQTYNALKSAPHNNTANVPTPDFNYGPNGGPGLYTILYPMGGVVQEGDVGYSVQEVQHDLVVLGETLDIDGYFGDSTYIGVEAFQNVYNSDFGATRGYITVDEKVGKQTYTALQFLCGYENKPFYGAD